jgi:DNA primase small subunit
LEKEFVLDIDISDYDEIRTCCQEANLCSKCWQWITIAMKLLDRTLRGELANSAERDALSNNHISYNSSYRLKSHIEDFGFKHMMWVYSGRRGVHCWVADERARRLSTEARLAVADYLNVIKGGEQQRKKVFLTNELHPSLQRAWNLLEPYFEPLIVVQQNILGNQRTCKELLELVPQKSIRDKLWETWQNSDDGEEAIRRWRELCQELDLHRLQRVKQEIVLQYLYPRLDINVSKQIHHLLKAPFCVHPKTGRICVPIDIKTCDTFDPTNVPCLIDLLGELNENLSSLTTEAPHHDDDNDHHHYHELEKNRPEYTYTSLKPYIQGFESFIRGVEEETRLARIKLQQGKSHLIECV